MMTTHNQDKHRDKKLSDQAIEWFVRLNSGETREIDTKYFDSWLATSDAHRMAFERVESIWQEMDSLKTIPFPELDKALACWEAGDLSGKKRRSIRLFSSFRLQLAMAAISLLIVAGTWFLNSFRAVTTSYQTAPGEQKTITLTDSSTIEINTNTTITVKMSTRARKVILSRGEAFFTVSYEEKRPFEVTAGCGTIRVLGTHFNVYKRQERVMVSVIEGSVQVSTKVNYGFTSEIQNRVLTKSQQLSYMQGGKMSPVEAINIKQVTAWREGKLIFDEMPLAGVIREVNRYRTGQIRIADSRLKDLKVSGIFRNNDLDSILRALKQIFPVKARRVSDRLIILEHVGGS